MGLPDYAEIVLDRVDDPRAKAARKVLRLEGMLMLGKFDEVRAIIAQEPDQNSQDTWAMKLKLADSRYAWGKYAEARRIYDTFFQRYPDGPPEALNDFYLESAYKYAQMLILMGERKGAVGAYEAVLKADIENHVRRQVISEMAEVLVALAEVADRNERAGYIKRVNELCTGKQGILWVQDLWFGKGIVLLAHVKLIEGDVDGAMEMVQEYWDQLLSIDRSLREEAEGSQEDMTKLSPMAECRYMLGVMMQGEAEKLLAGGGDRQKALALLAGKQRADARNTKKRNPGAFQHFLNVFIRYPTTPWAPDAGTRAEKVKGILENEFGAKIDYTVTEADMEKVKAAQFQEARSLYNQQRFADAVESYLKVLTLFPEGEQSVASLGELARCYIELGDEVSEIHAETVLRHLSERFNRTGAMARAGDQVLMVANVYSDRKMPDREEAVYSTYFTYFGAHPRTPRLLYRFGRKSFDGKDWARALAYFQRIVDNHEDSLIYPDAVSKAATCHAEMGDREAETKLLLGLVTKLEQQKDPGHALVSAKFRLGYAFKEWDDKYLGNALQQYTGVIKLLTENPDDYAETPEQAENNENILQGALFYRAVSYALLTEPEEKVRQYKELAVKSLEDLVERAPKSQFAPAALSQIGTLWTVLEEPDKAEEALRRLQTEYPESKEAKNANFMLAMSLLRMGRRQAATRIFKEMFLGGGDYSPRQILTAGTELRQAGEEEMAVEALERVLASANDDALIERALLEKGRALVALERHADSVTLFTEMLGRYPKSRSSVEGSLLLSQSYAALGQAEANADKRFDLFNESIDAMKRVRKYETTPGARARSTVGVGRIYVQMAAAEERFGVAEKAKEALDQAIVGYQTLILFGDDTDAEVRAFIEQAYAECLPLLLSAGRWRAAIEDCDAYFEKFPMGSRGADMRGWRNQARLKMITQGEAMPGVEPTPGEQPEEETAQ